MGNILEYKGYHTKVEFDSEQFVLRGKIEGINDLVNFSSSDIAEIEKEFHDAVDDYLEFCKEIGKDPDKEYKGTFNVRITPELHKKLAVFSMKNGDSLNSTVEKAIAAYINGNQNVEFVLQNSMRILAEAVKTESTYRHESTINTKTIPFCNFNSSYDKEMTN